MLGSTGLRRVATAAVVPLLAATLSVAAAATARADGPPGDDYDLTATAAGPDAITLHWSKGAGSTNHQVFEGVTAVSPVLGDVDTYTVTGLACGSYHTYQVGASNSYGPSAQWSEAAHATTDACGSDPTGPPGDDYDLTAAGGPNAITLHWSKGTGSTNHQVFEGVTAVSPVLGDVDTYTVTGLACGSYHTYQVGASNSYGPSGQWSNAAHATTDACGGGGGTAPAAPTGVTASGGTGSVALSWTKSSGATGYRVFEGTTQVGPDLGDVSSTTVTGLACGTTHAYTVVAFNATGASARSAPASATTAACAGGNRSGLAWLSGGGIDVSISEFERYRGRPMDTVDTWPNRGNWTELENPDIYGAISGSAGFPGRIVIGTTMVPNDGTSSLAACASGAYDAHLRTYGQKLVALGRGDSIIRLGWEMNILGTGNDAQVPHGDYASWTGCWRHWHDAVMSVPGAAFLWDFNPNSDTHYDAVASGNIESIYPGDAYVDLIGPDYYDQFPDITDDAGWDAEYNATQGDVVNGIRSPRGMGAWLWYATVFHHKLLSVPEWGISAGRDGSGDAKGAYFVGRMARFFRDNAAVVHDEEVFSIDSGVYGCNFVLDPPTCNPQSSAAYAANF